MFGSGTEVLNITGKLACRQKLITRSMSPKIEFPRRNPENVNALSTSFVKEHLVITGSDGL